MNEKEKVETWYPSDEFLKKIIDSIQKKIGLNPTWSDEDVRREVGLKFKRFLATISFNAIDRGDREPLILSSENGFRRDFVVALHSRRFFELLELRELTKDLFYDVTAYLDSGKPISGNWGQVKYGKTSESSDPIIYVELNEKEKLEDHTKKKRFTITRM